MTATTFRTSGSMGILIGNLVMLFSQRRFSLLALAAADRSRRAAAGRSRGGKPWSQSEVETEVTRSATGARVLAAASVVDGRTDTISDDQVASPAALTEGL
jgi:hypothetical protein